VLFKNFIELNIINTVENILNIIKRFPKLLSIFF
jgi:hypothetical protein